MLNLDGLKACRAECSSKMTEYANGYQQMAGAIALLDIQISKIMETENGQVNCEKTECAA